MLRGIEPLDITLASENKSRIPPMPDPVFVEALDTRFPMVVSGSGPPVLFVHGAWADLGIWCGLREEIADKHRFMAMTQRHFGGSAWPGSKPFSREVHTEDLLALIEALGKPVHLVGWSYAGGILLRVAGKIPELVRSLTIYEPSFESEAPSTDESLRRARETFWKQLEPAYSIAQTGDLDAAMRLGVEIVFGLGDGGFESLDSRFQQVFLDNAHTMIPDMEAPVSQALTESELERVTCPALIVSGERSHQQYRLMAEATLDGLPNASAVIFDGVGHGGPVQVQDRFAQTVLGFIQGIPPVQ